MGIGSLLFTVYEQCNPNETHSISFFADGSVKELFINCLIQSQYSDVAAKIKSSTDVQTKDTSEQQMTSQIDNSAMTEREIKNHKTSLLKV